MAIKSQDVDVSTDESDDVLNAGLLSKTKGSNLIFGIGTQIVRNNEHSRLNAILPDLEISAVRPSHVAFMEKHGEIVLDISLKQTSISVTIALNGPDRVRLRSTDRDLRKSLEGLSIERLKQIEELHSNDRNYIEKIRKYNPLVLTDLLPKLNTELLVALSDKCKEISAEHPEWSDLAQKLLIKIEGFASS